MINWFKRKMTILALSLSNVEKNALGQSSDGLTLDSSMTQRLNQGKLSDSLINGEITQEVQNLKWRTYKILQASEGVTAEIIGYDEDGMPITRIVKKDNKRGLKKVKVDSADDFSVEMVIDNTEISFSSNDSIDNKHIEIYEQPETNHNEDGEIVSTSHGQINGLEYFATNSSELPIKIIRDTTPNFYLENFTKKLVVRKITEEQKLLEFYVSAYPDEYNRTTRLFISAIKKAIEKPFNSSMLEFNNVEFITYKSIGVSDFLEFNYEIKSFDKIIEFNGSYVIKFIANVIKNGEYIMEKHRVNDLDDKYNNKLKK